MRHVGRVEHAIAAGDSALERRSAVVRRGIGGTPVVGAVGHDVGGNRLRTQHRHPDALVVVGDRQPLGERDRGRLGHRVRHRADLREQAGGRRRVQQIALAAGDHRGQHGTGGVDVRHAVHLPHRLDRLVRVLETGGGDEAGVRHEQIDRAVGVERRLDHPADRVLVADVDGDGGAADVVRRPVRPPQPFRSATTTWRAPAACRRAGDRLTDSRSGSGDDDDTIREFHAAHRRRRHAQRESRCNSCVAVTVTVQASSRASGASPGRGSGPSASISVPSSSPNPVSPCRAEVAPSGHHGRRRRATR